MFRWLVALFILVPALEIWGLISIGRLIGGWPTFLLVLLTGFLGAYLAKREAQRVWRYANDQMARGQVPTASILDAICIFAGGLLLLLPGFLTDIAGLVLLLPVTRSACKAGILYLLQKQLAKGSIRFFRRW
ncbi:FxsA family protein [Paenibacillus aurantius]|uniref:FxsA family protein n=1 Tax=Paenibacillus aurantius TaxID=2918900 RepID=A0AA96RBZ0_9BACL|nr:FxsA family protein [Paenibacillus aurantius]WJH34731.1 membrane protein FxsA [Paenibacillus sp. CC-CFT747]WNQ09940.1 FxsA family protein [Paenibacillus aurantius]